MYQNKIGLPTEMLYLLKKDFTGALKKDLADKIMTYVLDGEEEDILEELTATRDCGKKLRLYNCSWDFDGVEDRLKFFKNNALKEPGLYYRLGQVYAAATLSISRIHPNKLYWLECLICEARKDFEDIPFPADILEEMLRLDGKEENYIVSNIFPINTYSSHDPVFSQLKDLPGIGKYIGQHTEELKKALGQNDKDILSYAIESLKRFHVPLEPIAKELAQIAMCSTKSLRKQVLLELFSIKQKCYEYFKDTAENGKAGQRGYAVDAILYLYKKEAVEFLKQRQEQEKSKKIKEKIAEFLQSVQGFEQEPIQLPKLPSLKEEEPLPQELLPQLEEALQGYNIDLQKVKELFDSLQKQRILSPKKHGPLVNTDYPEDEEMIIEGLKAFAQNPSIKPIHLVRLLAGLGELGYPDHYEEFYFSNIADQTLKHLAQTSDFGLRELAHILKFLGYDERLGEEKIDQEEYDVNESGKFLDWKPQAIWPYFAENIHLCEEVFGIIKPHRELCEYELPQMKRNVMDILSAFEKLPLQFKPKLWEIALTKGVKDKYLAQKCLRNETDIEKRLLKALEDKKYAVRANAAEWIGNLNKKELLPQLKKVLKNEKHDKVRIIYDKVLEKLGGQVLPAFDKQTCSKEAKKVLEKGIPKNLSWFSFAKLPKVHWEKTTEEVEKNIVTWLIVQGNKAKSPDPDSWMQKICVQFDQKEREILAEFILQSWITQDTLPVHSLEEAKKLAQADYDHWGKDVMSFQECLNEYLHMMKGSAIKEKGILSVVSACGGAGLVLLIDKYLKDWYGRRAAQCKALLSVLSWLDEAMAIQLLLSVSAKFRTKSIRDEAQKIVTQLAKRKGWTEDELADHTIPTAGLQNNKLEFDYGGRIFIASLDTEFNWTLKDETGKKIKALPTARKGEDEEKVKAVKKSFNKAKKELKSILTIQKDRLYTAMCIQRTWKFADWNKCLQQHSIIGRYCQQLLWGVFEKDKLIKSFRPLDDGTLSDFEDEEVTVKAEENIKLIHDYNIDAQTCKNWQQHFIDYKISPLFSQIGRELYPFDTISDKASRVDSFENYVLDFYKLRGELKKLGYNQGPVDDERSFNCYTKSLPSLGLEAVIEFSGGYFAMGNEKVRLTCFYLNKGAKEIYQRRPEKLKNIPPILLTEIWHHMKQLASVSEHDKDAKKKYPAYN